MAISHTVEIVLVGEGWGGEDVAVMDIHWETRRVQTGKKVGDLGGGKEGKEKKRKKIEGEIGHRIGLEFLFGIIKFVGDNIIIILYLIKKDIDNKTSRKKGEKQTKYFIVFLKKI